MHDTGFLPSSLLSISGDKGIVFGDPGLAEKVLKEGKADFIALARPLLADPRWPTKVNSPRLERRGIRIGIPCDAD